MKKLIIALTDWWLIKTCEHENWTCDTQIRVIECQRCGKRAWIKKYKNLFKK